VHRLPDELADVEAAKVAGPAFDALSFAWAGGTAPGEPHYYRIQGKTVLIEYDNTQNGVNHVHAVWRERGRDFGGDVLMEHYRAAH
jgi:hypothetical protein